MKEKQNITIAVLATLAVTLIAAHLFVPLPVAQAEVVRDRDYQVVTARITTGGDALYIHDVRTGQVAVFTYDAGSRSVQPRRVRALADAFAVPR